MPQASPILWLSLFIIFCSLLVVTVCVLYSTSNYPNMKVDVPLGSKKLTWKW